MNKNKRSKETAKLLFTIFNVVLFTALFFVMLYFIYPNVNYKLNGYAIVIIIYFVFLVVFGQMFDMYTLGDTRVYDLFLSYSLALLVSNAMIFLVICLASFRLMALRPIIWFQIGSEFIIAIMLLLENGFIRDHFPIPKAIAIFGEPNYEILEKIHKYRDILVTVKEKADIKDIDLNNLDEFLGGYERVITIDVAHDDKKEIFKKCYEKKISVYDIPSITDTLISASEVMHVIDTPILKINKFGPSYLEATVKRAVDILGSLLLIIVTSPIMIVTAILIKLYDGGDVFFKQTRLTRDEKEFKIIKFRSMIMNAESKTGAVLAKENDDRITPIGRFIRKVRFDELPQLFNILKGDMTFVGPRPERPELFEKICEEIPEFKYRLNVTAGLTGYAQIYGKYNTTMRDKLLLDLYYIENYSLISDLKLLVMTIKIVFVPESTEGVK